MSINLHPMKLEPAASRSKTETLSIGLIIVYYDVDKFGSSLHKVISIEVCIRWGLNLRPPDQKKTELFTDSVTIVDDRRLTAQDSNV